MVRAIDTGSYQARGVVWNLEPLYSGPEDPRIDQDLDKAEEAARVFKATYRGRLREVPREAETLFVAIRQCEAIHETAMRPFMYAELLYAFDTRDPSAGQCRERVRERWGRISRSLAFFQAAVGALPEQRLRSLAQDEALTPYRYYLLTRLRLKPHTLSEAQETEILGRRLRTRHPLVSRYDRLVGSLTVPVGAGGEKRSLNAQQALATLLSPDRSDREAAYKSLLTRVAQEGPLFGRILNGIMEDHLQEARERQLPTPLHAMHLKNGVDEEIFRTVIETAEDIDPTIRRYFRMKAQRLGLERLKDTDLLAPWSRDAPRFRFSQAVEILKRALGRFHPAFHAEVRECLREGRIDAEVRDGKAGGAFCRTYWPSIPPHIMLGFNGYLRDLVTLAHEMGHGIHYGMASGQTGVLFKPPPILAETASTFAEILLYHDLSGRAEFDAYRGDLLASQIEGIYLTISRQKVITRFETALYDVREDHILEKEEICRLWLEEHARLVGEDVERVPGYGWAWAHVPHPFHSPFYCYSYVLGNLLAVRLFQVYMEQGEGFRDEIVRLLGAGDSRDPMELLRDMGLDPSRASFWRAAVPYIRRLVDALEALP